MEENSREDWWRTGMTRGTRESRREKVKWTVTGSRWKTMERDRENSDSAGSVGKIGKERKRGKVVESGGSSRRAALSRVPGIGRPFPSK